MNAPVLKVRCPKCSHRFKLYNYNGEMPECPVCCAEIEDKLDLSKPVRIATGGSPMDRAVKITQDVAERDYGLTDLRTNLDPGEIAAPKLTPQQQIMDRAWKQGGGWNAPQRFPGLQPGQGWMDAARAATAATGQASIRTVSSIMGELKGRKLVVEDAASGRKRAVK